MKPETTPKSRLTIIFLLSFLVTSAFLYRMQLPQYPPLMWLVLVIAGFLSFILAFKANAGRVVLCVVLGAGIAFLRVGQTTHIPAGNSVELFAGIRSVSLHGVISAEPDKRPLKIKYTVSVDGIAYGSGQFLPVTGKVLVTDNDQWPPHDYGDEVVVRGKLELPGRIEDFRYDRYLSRYGIYGVIYKSKIATISRGHGNAMLAFLYRLKKAFELQINKIYPEPHASFMAGLLTGSRRGIPTHLLDDFQKTGLTHIIAISGYNITIVMSFIAWLLFFIPLKWRFIPSVAAVIFFTLFVGASPSVVRAAIMGTLGLFALQTGRMKHSLIAVLLAAFLMVSWNPKFLWYDAGFQLSFLAVIGLVFISPLMDSVMRHVTDAFALREALQMTLAAQLTAVPLIVLLFGNFSLVAPLANILVAFLIPLGMFFGFAGTVVSFFLFPLGQLIAYVGWGMLEIIIIIAHSLANAPFALVEIHAVPLWAIAAYYALLALVVYFIGRMQKSFFPAHQARG